MTGPGGAELVRVQVSDGYLVCVAGEQRGGTVSVPPDLAAEWVAAGWASPVPASPPRPRKAKDKLTKTSTPAATKTTPKAVDPAT